MGLIGVHKVKGRLSEVCGLVSALAATKQLASLWGVQDAGMPVFVHTVDVTLLALEDITDWEVRWGRLDIAAIALGSLLHDLTKASCRAHRQYTHSWVMSHAPDIAVSEAMDALDSAQLATGVAIDHEMAEHVGHIVASHHGPWGKVSPATPEAALVHHCDLYSAQHHRMSPVDANDILPLLAQGLSKSAAARRLGVGPSVVQNRLLDSCAVEEVRSVDELVGIWQDRGRVRAGSSERAAQLYRARWLIGQARNMPGSIVQALLAIEDTLA